MMKHKVGTKFSREYKGKTVTIKVTKNGYQYGKSTYKSLSAAVKEGIGSTTPASVFFKLKTKPKKKGKKGKYAATPPTSPITAMVHEAVAEVIRQELGSIREEVRSAVNGALQTGFRYEGDNL